MSMVERARDMLKYTGARKPMLLVSKTLLDQWLTETCDRHPPLIDMKKQFDGVPFRCVPLMEVGMHIVDLEP